MQNSAVLTTEDISQMFWDEQFIEELKQTIMAYKTFIPLSLYWVCYSHLSNNLLSRAAPLNRPNGLPNNIMNNFNSIALVIFILMTDRALFPLLHKYKLNVLTQRRITVGFFLGSLSMVYASVLQSYIYSDPAWLSTGQSTMSVFLKIPAYLLIAFQKSLLRLHPWNSLTHMLQSQ